MEKVLIDTNILIGVTRNQMRAEEALRRVAGAQLVICDIVLSEVLDGARNKAEHTRVMKELSTRFEALPFTPEISVHFREILIPLRITDRPKDAPLFFLQRDETFAGPPDTYRIGVNLKDASFELPGALIAANSPERAA